jgi:CheY-like chemotaxis protein
MNPIHILLVEDNEADILLTKEALNDLKIIVNLSTVNDGEKALDFLEKKGDYVSADTPDLILLDVNLPKKNGHEVLQFIKENNLYKHIPVIMLTTSSSEMDINLAYKNHANCFITKPIEVKDFLNVIASIENFWISLVKLPITK